MKLFPLTRRAIARPRRGLTRLRRVDLSPQAGRGKGGSAMRAIASLGLASFASQALVRAADTLLPQIAADFAISVGTASIVITAYALTHGSIQFVTGPIADRFGKYPAVALARSEERRVGKESRVRWA